MAVGLECSDRETIMQTDSESVINGHGALLFS